MHMFPNPEDMNVFSQNETNIMCIQRSRQAGSVLNLNGGVAFQCPALCAACGMALNGGSGGGVALQDL